MANVLIPVKGKQMPGWLAEPPSHEPAPGVLVLHDVFGMSQDLRDQAHWLAAAGFLALGVNLYHRGGMLLCIRQVIRDLMARTGAAFDDVEAARQWLTADPGCTGRVGVIGFCMGGGFALLLISGHGFDAASVNYGGPLPKDFDDFLNAACPVVGSYGGLAKWEQGVADQLREKLDRALIPNDCKEYADAGHAFMSHQGSWVMKLLRFAGIGYDDAATQDARRRIIEFFHLHLGG
jgi:carboxymethylenebutenolidase